MSTLGTALRLSSSGAALRYETCKRLLDLAGGLVGLVVLAFLLAPIAVAIRLDSRGPVFYTQLRVGKGGRLFRLFKFRSMKAAAEPRGARWTEPGDPRITRVGRVLRSTHLDELPQVLNLLRGDVTLVGPRPERPEFLPRLTALDPRYPRRHEVRPGLVGLAYIRQGYAASESEAVERLQHDLEYLESRSTGRDLWILARSLGKALRCGGR